MGIQDLTEQDVTKAIGVMSETEAQRWIALENARAKGAKAEHREAQNRALLADRGYDTLQDVDISKILSVSELYDLFFGKIVTQDFLAGTMIMGTIDLSLPQGGTWGDHSLGFEGHSELWSLRSSPRGRIGKPLVPGEVRCIAIMIRQGLLAKHAAVTTIRLWLLPGGEAYAKELQYTRSSYGALGTQMTGIHLFSHHGTKLLTEKNYTPGRDDYHAVLGSFCNVTINNTDEEERRNGLEKKILHVVPSIDSTYVLAANLAGFDLSDEPAMRHGIENFDHDQWLEKKVFLQSLFTKTLAAQPQFNAINLADLTAKFIFGAETIAETVSYAGFLDFMSDEFNEGALPDDMHRPYGIPLLMAMAVRVACEPSRCGLMEGTPDDRYAANEMRLMLEAIQEPVLDKDADGDEDILFAIDIALNHAVVELNREIDIEKNKMKNESKLNPEDVSAIGRLMVETLSMLYRTGILICVELCGVMPRYEDGTTGVYTEMGMAEALHDPLSHSRCESAHAVGLGATHTHAPPIRLHSVSTRQTTFLRLFSSVERWFRTGTYQCMPLRLQSRIPTTTTKVRYRGDAGLLPPTPERHGSTHCHKPLAVVGVDTRKAVTTTNNNNNNNKKKKGKGAKPVATIEQQKNKAQIVTNIQERGALHHVLTSASVNTPTVNQITKSTVAKQYITRQHERAKELEDQCCERVNEQAMQEGAYVIGEILSAGACFGTNSVVDAKVFLISKTAFNQCAHCARQVHVVANIAFGGMLGKCTACSHPRCLACVDDDIETACAEAVNPGLDRKFKATSLYNCQGCIFCNPTLFENF